MVHIYSAVLVCAILSYMSQLKRYRKALIFFTVLVAIGVFLYFVRPTEVVAALGVRNSLVIAFIVSLLGGVSTFTSASFFAVIGGLALGGVNPLALALVCGPALYAGDLVFFYFGKNVEQALPKRYEKKLEKLAKYARRKPDVVTPFIIFFYTGFTPFPGDILMVALALIKYPVRRMTFPLLMGNIALVATITLAALTGRSFFM